MLERLRFGRVYLLGSLLVLAAFLHPATAYSAPGDPPSGSPAGAVYELPLQQGRADAAPKGGGAGGPAAAGGGEAASVYRTENDFGSSSQVPGAPLAGSAGGAQGAGGAGAAAGGPAAAGGGPGGAGAASGGAGAAGGAIAGRVADAGNTSVPAGLGLLGAIALLAGGAAVLSRRYL
jgi:hypothetical protein